MESKELLERMDEVIKRVPVSYQIAKETLERNDQDVLATVLELEETATGEVSGQCFMDSLPKCQIALWRKRELMKVPVPFALGAVLLSMKRPRCLAALLGAVILSGADIRVLKEGEQCFSLHETFFQHTGLSAQGLSEMKGSVVDKLDDHFHDRKEFKEFGKFRDVKENAGVKHFTIRL